jgi:TatD DNase family protein
MYVDVHTHLTHAQFANDWREVIQRAVASGFGALVVNGLEPVSNRQVLAMAAEFPVVKPALGIYPLEAINHILPSDFKPEIVRFDVEEEIQFIRDLAMNGRIVAIGECGLDGYWVKEDTFAAQEVVFEKFIEIASAAKIPLIIHSRKLEQRTGEILAHHRAEKVNFHCFGGRVRLAKKLAEEHGWYFSIPANAQKNDAFKAMLTDLPADRLLTETDAPYLGPERGVRNEPANCTLTVKLLSELRGLPLDDARELVYANFQRLFGRN